MEKGVRLVSGIRVAISGNAASIESIGGWQNRPDTICGTRVGGAERVKEIVWEEPKTTLQVGELIASTVSTHQTYGALVDIDYQYDGPILITEFNAERHPTRFQRSVHK